MNWYPSGSCSGVIFAGLKGKPPEAPAAAGVDQGHHAHTAIGVVLGLEELPAGR
jgi:hypothetical protein